MSLPHFKPITEYYNNIPIYACEECKKLGIKQGSKSYIHKGVTLHLCDKHIEQLLRKQKLKNICQKYS